ncbi:MAG: MFS transporter [bacterium]|nr:MFS transporter [bacterium]
MRFSSTTCTSTIQPIPRLAFLAALYNRNFRYLWLSFICSSFVQRMDGIMLGWLVLEMTHSATWVGLIAAVRFLGALLGPLTGVMADRVDRRHLSLATLGIMTLVIAVLVVLVVMRRLEIWHLFAATTIRGVLWAFFQPAQQSLQADILTGRELPNGISLINMAMNMTSIIGPVLGGLLLACCRPALRVLDWSDSDMVLRLNWSTYDAQHLYATTSMGKVLISRDLGVNWTSAPFSLPGVIARSLAFEGAAIGVQWAYLTLLSLHLIQLFCYIALRIPPHTRRHTDVSIWQNLRDGMYYVRQDTRIWTALGLAALVNWVSFPLSFTLLPIFARDVFSVGAAGLGVLAAAVGVGALLGSWFMMATGTVRRAGSLMLVGTLLWQCFILVFALTSNYYLALGALVFIGISQSMSLTNISIMLLGTGSREMRGRIMGLRSLAVAPLFFGSLFSGIAAEHIGASHTAIICAVLGLMVVIGIAPWVPRGAPGN